MPVQPLVWLATKSGTHPPAHQSTRRDTLNTRRAIHPFLPLRVRRGVSFSAPQPSSTLFQAACLRLARRALDRLSGDTRSVICMSDCIIDWVFCALAFVIV